MPLTPDEQDQLLLHYIYLVGLVRGPESSTFIPRLNELYLRATPEEKPVIKVIMQAVLLLMSAMDKTTPALQAIVSQRELKSAAKNAPDTVKKLLIKLRAEALLPPQKSQK